MVITRLMSTSSEVTFKLVIGFVKAVWLKYATSLSVGTGPSSEVESSAVL